jgi:hypothetical protein
VQLVTFTTPAVAVRPAQEANVPLEAVRAIVIEELVTTLPAESSTFTTGWVARVAPEAPPTGWVVKTSLVAVPKVEGEKLELVAPVRAPEVAPRV